MRSSAAATQIPRPVQSAIVRPVNRLLTVPRTTPTDNIADIVSQLSTMTISKPAKQSLPNSNLSIKQRASASARIQERKAAVAAKLGLPSRKTPTHGSANATAPTRRPVPATTPVSTSTTSSVPSRPTSSSLPRPVTAVAPVSTSPILSVPSRPTPSSLPRPVTAGAPVSTPTTSSVPSRPTSSSLPRPVTATPSPSPPTLPPPPRPPPRSTPRPTPRPRHRRRSITRPLNWGPADRYVSNRRHGLVRFLGELPNNVVANGTIENFYPISLHLYGIPSRIPFPWPVLRPRGTYAYCDARPHGHGHTGNFGWGARHDGRSCECHGIPIPGPYPLHWVHPQYWSTTPAEADIVDASRPRRVQFNDTITVDSFEKWYMDAYGPAESSEDPATIEDDEQEDEELNASSGDDPNSTERADEEPNASSGDDLNSTEQEGEEPIVSSGDDLNSTEQEGEEPIVSSGDDPNSTWQNWQELMDEYIFDDDED